MSLATPRKGYKSVPWLFGKAIEIPEEWEVSRQGSVCEFINGYAYSEKEISKIGYPIIRIQNLTGGTKYVHSNVKLPEKQFAVEGDLLYAWSATFSPFIWHGEKSAFHYHQWKVIPNEKSDKMFLFYHFERVTPIIKNMGQSGLGMFHMTKNGMERFQFFKPPLPEQQKIANILSNVDNLIESTGKVITHSKKVKTGLMQKLLTRGIGHVTFKKVPWLFGKEIEIPEEWEVKRLDDVAHIQRGKFSHRPRGDPNYFNGKYPYIQTGDIEKANGFITTHSQTLNEKGKAVSKLFTTGIIVITIVGVNIGNTAITTYPIYFPDSIVGISSDSSNIQFLKILLETKKEILKNTAINNARENLNLEILRNLKIIHPQLSEQQKIASILSNIDSKITSQEQYKEKLERLKKSLMQKLLTGEVRV
jgi:type I restriction enzyme, S subunit